jgi:GT2 family glycosyltransferase
LLTPADPATALSVIIPNWNGRKLIGACLDSLRRQTRRDLEVIVVENGSVDGSSQFIRENYPEVRLLEQQINLGFAGGVNEGIRRARGRQIALLNNDAVVELTWADEMIKALDEADIVQAKMLQFDDHQKIDSIGDFVSKWGLAYPLGRSQADSGESKAIRPIFSACGGSAAYRRRVFETVGLFDEAFFAYLEDVDLSFRARLAGFQVVMNPQAIAYHHLGATAAHLGSFSRYHFIRNSFYLFLKNFPTSLLIRALPRFLLIQLLMFFSASKKAVPHVALRAYLRVLVRLPKLIKQRIQIQSTRRVSPDEVADWLTDYDPTVAWYVGKIPWMGASRAQP